MCVHEVAVGGVPVAVSDAAPVSVEASGIARAAGGSG